MTEQKILNRLTSIVNGYKTLTNKPTRWETTLSLSDYIFLRKQAIFEISGGVENIMDTFSQNITDAEPNLQDKNLNNQFIRKDEQESKPSSLSLIKPSETPVEEFRPYINDDERELQLLAGLKD